MSTAGDHRADKYDQPQGEPAIPGAYTTTTSKLTALGCLGAVGVVFGDIGTSPLYAFKEGLLGARAVGVQESSVFGILSMIFWAVTLIVSIKYVVLMMRADNEGEGGTLALLALIMRTLPKGSALRRPAIVAGLLGAAMFYGDSVITPAISVLSAVEGLEVAAPALHAYIVPLALAILVALFAVQRRGVGQVGRVFGPICLLWFLTIGALGLMQIVGNPRVLESVSPTFAVQFARSNPWIAFLILGSVFLTLTGAEALYADMGHFGTSTIRVAWFTLVMPALMLNYFGQGALVLSDPSAVRNPFFLMAPSWMSLPLVLLATAATVIASQAVISGAFTITSQAIKLGFVPRMKIEYTSTTVASQIYVPFVNWMLLVTIVLLVIGFQQSERLAGAYGLAVAATLLIDTLGITYIAMVRWQWKPWTLGLVFIPILLLDTAFLASNAVGKITHGGWFPLLFGAVMFFLFLTWKQGRNALEHDLASKGFALDPFIKSLTTYPPRRIEGTAVFMSPQPGILPHALLHNLKHNRVLHERTIFLSAVTETVPHVPPDGAVTVRDLGDGCFAVMARLGFQDPHDIAHIASMLTRKHDFDFSVQETSFFLSRQSILTDHSQSLSPWRAKVFSWMMRNAQPASDFFQIPPNRVIEIGTQVSI